MRRAKMTQPRLREISPQKYLSAPLPSGAEGLKPINLVATDQGRRKSNVPAKVKDAPNRSSIHQDNKTSKQDNQNPQATLTAQMEKLNNVQIRAFRQIFENFDLEKQTGVALDKEGSKGNSDGNTPGDVLFNILQRVLEQDENTDLRNFYRQQILNKMDDNVIHDWSDGKR